MQPSIWVVLVDYNGLEDSRKCLVSLVAQTIPCRIVVVDNASSEKVAPQLQPTYPQVDFVRSPRNGGWAGGNNLGIQHALAQGAQFIVLLNNDTVVAPELTQRLLEAFAAHPTFGILGPVIRFMEEPCEVQTEGVIFNPPQPAGFFQRLSIPLTAHSPPHVTEVDIVNGCCLAVRREVFERIGLIDEAYFLIHEESDFCLRAQSAGFRCGVIDHALVWHKGSSTFKRAGMRTQRYYDARNLRKLLSRHPTGRGRKRNRLASRVHYWNYAYYRYAIELENHCPDSAQAVLEGVYDGLLSRSGPYRKNRRPGLALLRWAFSGRRWLSDRFKPQAQNSR